MAEHLHVKASLPQFRWRTGAIIAGAAILLLEVASMFVAVSWSSSRARITWEIGEGMLQYRADPLPPPPPWPSGLHVRCVSGAAFWPRRWSFADRAFQIEEWPLWAPAAPLLVGAYLACRFSRRTPGRCDCGYDLKGNVSGRCPECGTLVPADIAPLRY